MLKERGACGTQCDRNELKCRAGMCKFTAGKESQNCLIAKANSVFIMHAGMLHVSMSTISSKQFGYIELLIENNNEN